MREITLPVESSLMLIWFDVSVWRLSTYDPIHVNKKCSLLVHFWRHDKSRASRQGQHGQKKEIKVLLRLTFPQSFWPKILFFQSIKIWRLCDVYLPLRWPDLKNKWKTATRDAGECHTLRWGGLTSRTSMEDNHVIRRQVAKLRSSRQARMLWGGMMYFQRQTQPSQQIIRNKVGANKPVQSVVGGNMTTSTRYECR